MIDDVVNRRRKVQFRFHEQASGLGHTLGETRWQVDPVQP